MASRIQVPPHQVPTFVGTTHDVKRGGSNVLRRWPMHLTFYSNCSTHLRYLRNMFAQFPFARKIPGPWNLDVRVRYRARKADMGCHRGWVRSSTMRGIITLSINLHTPTSYLSLVESLSFLGSVVCARRVSKRRRSHIESQLRVEIRTIAYSVRQRPTRASECGILPECM